ncbi:MAG: nuclear transport factor 2 family protein [Patulibacter minatonensis]
MESLQRPFSAIPPTRRARFGRRHGHSALLSEGGPLLIAAPQRHAILRPVREQSPVAAASAGMAEIPDATRVEATTPVASLAARLRTNLVRIAPTAVHLPPIWRAPRAQRLSAEAPSALAGDGIRRPSMVGAAGSLASVPRVPPTTDDLEAADDELWHALLHADADAVEAVSDPEIEVDLRPLGPGSYDDLIGGLRTGRLRFHELERSRRRLRIVGELATATSVVDGRATHEGVPRTARLRWVTTWRLGAEWVVVAAQCEALREEPARGGLRR